MREFPTNDAESSYKADALADLIKERQEHGAATEASS